MKKFICFLLLCVVLTILTACANEPFERPEPGIWVSDNPAITINISPEYRITPYGAYPSIPYGVYIRDAEELNIIAGFSDPFNNVLTIHNAAFLGPNRLIGDSALFSGRITIDGDRFYFRLNPRWQEEYGIREIVFTRIGDYGGTLTE